MFTEVTVLFGGAAPEKENTSIVVATDATWPPMEYIDKNKNIVGFDIDLVKEISKRSGLIATFESTAWDGIFAGLKTKKYDAVISSVTITEERKKSLDFSIPYINAGQVLMVRTETAKATKSIDELQTGSILGAQLGTTGAEIIQQKGKFKLKTYDELGFAIEDLVNKKIDGVVADTPIAANFALQNPRFKEKLTIIGSPLTSELYGIVVRKGNIALLQKINTALRSIIKDGTLNTLKQKWLQ